LGSENVKKKKGSFLFPSTRRHKIYNLDEAFRRQKAKGTTRRGAI